MPDANSTRDYCDLPLWARPIPGFPGYYIEDGGAVYSTKGGNGRRTDGRCKRLRVQYSQGYMRVELSGGIRRHVHQLLLETFVGPCPEGMETRHLNGNGMDNRLDNLCWGTAVENAADRVEHGTAARGERAGNAVLTETIVVEIKRRIASGEPIAWIARSLNVRRTTVQQIKTGNNWQWVPGDVARTKSNRGVSYSKDDVLDIRKRYAAGETLTSIARAFGKSASSIKHIVTRSTWKHVP